MCLQKFTLSLNRVTIVAAEKQYVFLSSYLSSTQNSCAILLLSVACLAVDYFSALANKRYDLQNNVIEQKCVVIFCTTFFLNNSNRSEIL